MRSMPTSSRLGWHVGSVMCVDTADIRIFLLLDLFHWEALPRKLGAPILPSAVIVEIRQASTRRRGFWTSWARWRFSVGHARSLVFLQTALFALWHGTSDYPGMGFVRAHTILSYALPTHSAPGRPLLEFRLRACRANIARRGAPMMAKAAH